MHPPASFSPANHHGGLWFHLSQGWPLSDRLPHVLDRDFAPFTQREIFSISTDTKRLVADPHLTANVPYGCSTLRLPQSGEHQFPVCPRRRVIVESSLRAKKTSSRARSSNSPGLLFWFWVTREQLVNNRVGRAVPPEAHCAKRQSVVSAGVTIVRIAIVLK
jgi:hypothetical protein